VKTEVAPFAEIARLLNEEGRRPGATEKPATPVSRLRPRTAEPHMAVRRIMMVMLRRVCEDAQEGGSESAENAQPSNPCLFFWRLFPGFMPDPAREYFRLAVGAIGLFLSFNIAGYVKIDRN